MASYEVEKEINVDNCHSTCLVLPYQLTRMTRNELHSISLLPSSNDNATIIHIISDYIDKFTTLI